MSKNFFIGIAFFLFGYTTLHGQSALEMHHLNRHQNLGTARSAGVGGAFSALGNDFSSIHINPAGAGVFRREQIDVHFGIFSHNNTTSFNGQQINGSQNNESGITITNFGKIWMMNEERNRSSVFALTFNQTASFRESYTGFAFVENPDGDIFEPGDIYDEIVSREIIGTQHEMGLTFGFNEGYKWYYGFGIGVPFTTFRQNYFNDQSLRDESNQEVGFVEYDEGIDISGIGINARAGVIYRPIPALRIGVSAQTPTAHSFNGEFDYILRDGGIFEEFEEDRGFNPNYRYTAYNAARLNAGMAYVFDKIGFISIDYDFVDPRTSRYGGRDMQQSMKDNLREDIRSDLAPMHHLRAGTEIRFGGFFLRGGYSLTTSGYSERFNATNITGVHGGIGYQTKKFGINMSLVNFQSSTGEFVFDQNLISTPFMNERNRTMFTLGITILQ